MAFINCSECGRKVSDTVKVCPCCGYKIKKNRNAGAGAAKRLLIAVAVSVIIVLGFIGAISLESGLNKEEKAQVISLNERIHDVVGSEIVGSTREQLLSLREECQDIEREYVKLQDKQKKKIDNYEAVNEQITSIDMGLMDIRRGEIQYVIQLINDVGEVTVQSRDSIDKAKMAYEMLDDEQKAQVENFGQIEVYEARYKEARINEAITCINNIGSVSPDDDSEKRIADAERVYNDLPQELKGAVSNYGDLTDKRNQLTQLEEYRDLLLSAEAQMRTGYLNKATGILKKIPSKFRYNGIKASDLKKQLSSKSEWVALCGEWKTTGGQMRVDQIWDYDGRSQGWYRNYDKGEETLSVTCKLLEDGRVKVSVYGHLPIYTSYSVIAEGLETSYVLLEKTKKMSSPGTIKIDGDTTMTLSPDGITVKYYMVNPNEDQYFTYKYKSTMNFGKRVKKY